MAKNPHQATFTKSVTGCCHRVEVGDDHPYVDMDRVIQEVFNVVSSNCPIESTTAAPIAPCALVRSSRGGKTVTLVKLFEAFKLGNPYSYPLAVIFPTMRGSLGRLKVKPSCV